MSKKLELGHVYKLAGYKWVPVRIDEDLKFAVMQSLGVTKGPWPGYSMLRFGNGDYYGENISGCDITSYDGKTQELMEKLAPLQATNTVFGRNLFLPSSNVVFKEPKWKTALALAARGSSENRQGKCWLGSIGCTYTAWYVTGRKTFNQDYQYKNCVIAPAFNLDLTEIVISDDDEITGREEHKRDNCRVFFHGTTMENAISMITAGFSKQTETVWNCSDPDNLYLVREDYDGDEEGSGLRFAAEAGQISAAYFGSRYSDIAILEFEIPQYMLDEAYVADDCSTDNGMPGCYEIERRDLSKYLDFIIDKMCIRMKVHILHGAYNREFRPFYIPANKNLNRISDPLLRYAVEFIHESGSMCPVFEDIDAVWESEDTFTVSQFREKYCKNAA